MAARKTFQTTIGIGGEISPTLAVAAASASKTLSKLAEKSEKLSEKEKRTLERNALAEKQLAEKLANQKGVTEEQAAMKVRQLREKHALEEQQLARENAAELARIEQQAAQERADLARESAAEQARIEQELARKSQAEFQSSAACQDMLRKYGDRMSKFGDGVLKTVTLPMLSLAALGIKTYMEFDDSMRQVQATLQASDSDMVQLTEAARQMGRDTRYFGVRGRAGHTLNRPGGQRHRAGRWRCCQRC